MERGEATKVVIAIILSAFVIFLGVQIWHFESRAKEAKAAYEAAKAARDDREGEEARLEAELQYYSNPANFFKELRARFNYHAPDEKGIILVPNSTSTD
jgi:hypothetical protein